MINVTTAGESHGKALMAIAEGVPANIQITEDYINHQLARRKLGYGRGGRMKIESDEAEIISGVRNSLTIGSPVGLLIENKDYANWKDVMSKTNSKSDLLTKPRPGHADLIGSLKTGQEDMRNILERSSARETAARVAGASICRKLLEEIGIKVISAVTSIADVESNERINPSNADEIDEDPLRMIDPQASKKAQKVIDEAASNGDTLGGTFRIKAVNVLPGLGGYSTWRERLDGVISQMIMSIPAIKGISFGKGFEIGKTPGSKAHDEIHYDEGFYRKTNRAGGLEGGMTNGEDIIINAVMKPIPTLGKPLKTVDVKTKKSSEAFKERADVTAVPSAAVIGESMVCIALANAVLNKFGSDNIKDIKTNIGSYITRIK